MRILYPRYYYRITRNFAFIAVSLVFFFNLHRWRSEHHNEHSEHRTLSKKVFNPKTEEIYKSHLGVYPVMKTELGNFEPKKKIRVPGPGEDGKPYLKEQTGTEFGMNMDACNDIPMNRTIPDTRMKECKFWDYPEELPSTSVIIVFHNEGFSVLMRTVHSVVDRSPPQFLKEVVLVDDFSDVADLKANLDNYIKRWDGKVRIIRNDQLEGLITTRSRGAREATGEVIVFLDAHCEVNINWLPPLLAPIYRDYRIMTVPVIDGIDYKTFEYRPVYAPGSNSRGIFEWGMLYKENEVPIKEASKHKYHSEPYQSPTHAGGLFAIHRKYFLKLGAYDPGLLIWGGENFELSFKIWQCGGSIEWVPCSRVGHVYRGPGRSVRHTKGSFTSEINYKRVIETWFDEEHKEFFYTRQPMIRYLYMGDISKQVALKKKLKCKDFGWFMENVAYDVYDKFPKLPKNVHWGIVENRASGDCLDTLGKTAPSKIGMSGCHGQGGPQMFRLNAAGQLGAGERCVEADKNNLLHTFCKLGTVAGPWTYNEENKFLIHRMRESSDSYCLTLRSDAQSLGLAPCDNHNMYQKWTISHDTLIQVQVLLNGEGRSLPSSGTHGLHKIVNATIGILTHRILNKSYSKMWVLGKTKKSTIIITGIIQQKAFFGSGTKHKSIINSEPKHRRKLNPPSYSSNYEQLVLK